VVLDLSYDVLFTELSLSGMVYPLALHSTKYTPLSYSDYAVCMLFFEGTALNCSLFKRSLRRLPAMAKITLQGNPVNTVGDLPAVGATAPDFTLTKTDLSDLKLSDLAGKTVVLNIFPSIDTPTCAMSVRKFNESLSNLDGVEVVCVSADLPFAMQRFCGAEGLERVTNGSVFRSDSFGKDYGVTIADSPLKGLMARSVVVIKGGKVVYTELVAETGDEPNYDAAMKAVA
jgi:thiol peroxidase